jgi:hypothetical protein
VKELLQLLLLFLCKKSGFLPAPLLGFSIQKCRMMFSQNTHTPDEILPLSCISMKKEKEIQLLVFAHEVLCSLLKRSEESEALCMK